MNTRIATGHSSTALSVRVAFALAIGATVALSGALGGTRPVEAGAEPPSPATGHAQVIAQGTVTFDDGPFHWVLTPNPVGTTDTPIDTSSATFVVSDGPDAVVVSDAAGPIARLAEGEALFRSGGTTTSLRTLSPTGGDGAGYSAVAGDGDPSMTFTPGPGTRDLDLVRDVLAANEALVLRTDVSAFVVVTAGIVNVGGTDHGAGSTLMLAGDIVMINRATEPAAVAAVVVGPLLDASGVLAIPPTPSTEPPATSPPADTAAPATTAPATTTSTTTTAPPRVDTDGDGLTDAEEAHFGTDPTKADTDGDQLSDHYEVTSTGSDPLKADTDGDGLLDNEEDGITRTDPLVPDHDNDGDGLWSTNEMSRRTSPNNPDTDGDQLWDGYEVNRSFTDPLNSDTDGDGLVDNVDHERCNANKRDTDGDGLTDLAELTQYFTDCRNRDTNGNGLPDPN